jgi:D-alanyl-lipoteichoic acid acyltransferase DltB (MBOAT superfamily)
MLSLLPLPITWLAFYGLGRVLDRVSLDARRYATVSVSALLLLAATGPTTWSFYLAVSLAILLAGHGLSRIENKSTQKLLFVVSIAAVTLLILAFLQWRIYFQKYFVYLPSLSYLGFRGIAYLTTVYKRRRIDFSAGLMQMFFFPMLFIGPISRVENFEEGYRDSKEVLRRLALGLSMLIGGFLCGKYVINDLRHAANLHWSGYWLGALANSFEFYFTFAGYSHLIIGLGILVGFKLPENFNNPYLATSIGDFWRRWHMSLSYWIRDYLYIPLGGNRKGIARKCVNLIVAMGLAGIWHGLALNYLLWGLFHGVLLAAESLMAHFNVKVPFFGKVKSAQIALTFTLVSFSWLLFKYPLPEFVLYLTRMVP